MYPNFVEEANRKNMSSRPLIKESLFLLNLVGVGFESEFNCSSRMRIALLIVVIMFVFVNVFLECILRFEGIDSVEAITITIALYQVVPLLFLMFCMWLWKI